MDEIGELPLAICVHPTYLEVDVDHDGGGRPKGDDAGEDGEVLVHHEVTAVLAVLPDEVEVLARRVDPGEDGHEPREAGEQPAERDHARHALKFKPDV